MWLLLSHQTAQRISFIWFSILLLGTYGGVGGDWGHHWL